MYSYVYIYICTHTSVYIYIILYIYNYLYIHKLHLYIFYRLEPLAKVEGASQTPSFPVSKLLNPEYMIIYSPCVNHQKTTGLHQKWFVLRISDPHPNVTHWSRLYRAQMLDLLLLHVQPSGCARGTSTGDFPMGFFMVISMGIHQPKWGYE